MSLSFYRRVIRVKVPIMETVRYDLTTIQFGLYRLRRNTSNSFAVNRDKEKVCVRVRACQPQRVIKA